jgi:hypothetical protein
MKWENHCWECQVLHGNLLGITEGLEIYEEDAW